MERECSEDFQAYLAMPDLETKVSLRYDCNYRLLCDTGLAVGIRSALTLVLIEGVETMSKPYR